ncbi:MAG: hypothetical protein IJE49_08460 [Agathobacter sp.]|nr:hypothetical protein [Agathobacter sp.]
MTNNKALFMKWAQILFYVQCAAVVVSLIASLPFVGSWFTWIIRIISIATVFVIYKLSPVNPRYRKAAIFMGISTILLVIFVKELWILVIVGAICSIIGMYQEYVGHSEVMAGIDDKLAKNWHSLFHWDFWGGLAVSFIGAICLTILTLTISSEVSVDVAVVIADGYQTILNIVYLVFLKRMLTVYANYEPQKEEEITNEG